MWWAGKDSWHVLHPFASHLGKCFQDATTPHWSKSWWKKGSISPTIWKAVLPKKTTYLSRFERWMVFPSPRFMSLKGWSKTLKPPLKHRASFAFVLGSSLGKDSFMSCRVVHLVWGCLEDIRILRWENSRDDKGPPCILVCAVCHGLKDDFLPEREWMDTDPELICKSQAPFVSRSPNKKVEQVEQVGWGWRERASRFF